MSKRIYFFVLSLFLIACDAKIEATSVAEQSSSPASNSSPAVEVSPPVYELVNEKKEIKDEFSPVGYWEQSRIYPKVIRGGSPDGRLAANSLILAFLDQYSCEEPGEYSFNTDVTYASDHVISFRYEIMWMCSGMPGPDSTSGAVNIDLQSGEDINLMSQLSSKEHATEFNSIVVAGLNTAIDHKSKDLHCSSASGMDSYYLSESDFTFLHINRNHGTSACDAYYSLAKQQLTKFLRADSVLLK